MKNKETGSDSPFPDDSKKSFQLFDTEFIRDTFGFSNRGVMSDRRNATKGVQIATNVDLSQWSEDELIHLDLPEGLIEKLAPFLGKKGMEAAFVLKETPLEITWYEADILSKAIMKHWAQYYSNIYDESVKSVKGRHLLTWSELDVHVRTIIYAVLQQVPSVSTVPAFWNHVTRQHWKHVHAELKVLDKQDLIRKGGESAYFAEFLKQENIAGENNSRRMVTLQLPDINAGLSRSMDNLNSSCLEDMGGKSGSGDSLSLSSSFDSRKTMRAQMGSPVPPLSSIHLRRHRSPSMNNKLLIDNFVSDTPDLGSGDIGSTSQVRPKDKEPQYPNSKLDHLGRKQRSSSFNMGQCEKSEEPRLPPVGYSEITIVDDITVMHRKVQPSSSLISDALSSCPGYAGSTPVSGSPNCSRRSSIALEHMSSPLGRRRDNSKQRQEVNHSRSPNGDRTRSCNNLLPPLDSTLGIGAQIITDSKIRSLDASPVTNNRSAASKTTLYVPSFAK